MPTAKQMKARSQTILAYVAQVRKGQIEIEKIPKTYRADVCAWGLHYKIITPADIPDDIADDVAYRFIRDASDRERDDAAFTGTDFHAIPEAVNNGEKIEIADHVRDHYRSWLQFVRDYEMEFIEVEFSVFSEKYGYAGTGDFMGFSHKYPELGLILGDYKTSKSGIWPDICLQLAGIAYADFIGRADFTEAPIPKFDTYWGVQITAEGYRVVRANVSIHTFNTFLSAINIARWKTEGEQFALDKTTPFIERTTNA